MHQQNDRHFAIALRIVGPSDFYLNSAAFALPAFGTYGNTGWNALAGPGAWSFDLSLSRTFRIVEGHNLEVRAEGYDVTNSFRPTFAVTTNQNGSI